MIIKYNVTLLLLIFFCRFSFADTYIWEDYDDFSGSTLDTSKWGTMYLGGGIEPHVTDGKLVLSGGVGNPSASKVVKVGWEDVFTGDDGGQVWLYAKEYNIFGIEAEFIIPVSANSNSGLQVGVASLNPLSYATVELNADPSSSSQYSKGFGFYHLSGGVESENFATTSRGVSHTLSTTIIDEKIKLYVDGSLSYKADAGTFNIDMFFLGAYNDYQSTGLPFTLNADNVRVLRRSTTTSLDGSTLVLSSTVGVSETMAFENGIFTSTFVDPQEGTIVKTGQNYTLDQITQDTWKITLEDGDTYSFDDSKGTGISEDFTTGNFSGDNSYELISGNLYKDLQGSGVFTFKHYEWEDYDDFSGSSLDTGKWDVSCWDGGNLPIIANGQALLAGKTNSSWNSTIATARMLGKNSNAVNMLAGGEAHSVLEFKESDDIYGIELNLTLPSEVPQDCGIGIYAIDYNEMFNGNEEGSIRFDLDLWHGSGDPEVQVSWRNLSTGNEEKASSIIASKGTPIKLTFVTSENEIEFFYNDQSIAKANYQNVNETFIVRAVSEKGEKFDSFLDNVRVLRRSQVITEPDSVTVASDTNGQPVVVQVGNEYMWNNSLDGVTLWSVEWETGESPSRYTFKFENGRNVGTEGFYDSLTGQQPYDKPYVVDENGYLKVTENNFQYYNVVSLENGIIGTIQDDEGLNSVANNGANQVDQWFFTTRLAAEEFYYSKAGNPKGWLWFDHYPWVYSNKEQGWLYFKPSGGKLMYFSHNDQIWLEFN